MRRKWLIPLLVIAFLWAEIDIRRIGEWLKPNPLEQDGYTIRTDGSEQIVVSLVNAGRADARLREVRVNGGEKPDGVQLVISYSGQLVPGSLANSSWHKEYAIGEQPIRPRLTQEGMLQAIRVNEASPGDPAIPIHYGIMIRHHEPIESVKIRYRYLGIPFTRTVPIQSR